MSVALADELHRLGEEGSTGILRAGDGEFHLVRGTIASVGCERTIGLDRLAVEAGVATAEDWRRAGAGDPGPLLHRPQLETLALLSVFDAAYFLLASDDEPEFLATPEHWLAPVCHIAPRALVHECERRSDSDDSAWSADLVTMVPVVPARRVKRNQLLLTGSQVEVLAAADTRRSIADIARELGRTTYGCLVAVRQLTAAGVIEPPQQVNVENRGRHLTLAPTLADHEPSNTSTPHVPSLPKRIPGSLGPVRSPQGTGARSGRHAIDEEATASTQFRVTRSHPAQPEQWEQVDREILIRLRAALEELA
ncbi:hypothetical protein ACFWU5_22060 [Nocardia sp. NPDC058640]|uniref:hypothetical protein n=1 Tax=Nocardia sp. NPDC058640 TaxID=3346571 RepID=UPI00364DAF4E